MVKFPRCRRWLALGAVLGILLTERPAAAHPELSPQLVNRYLSVFVLDDSLEVSLLLLFGALPAAVERKRMDTDGDGRLSLAERADAQRRWQREADALFSVSVDGEATTDLPTVDVQIGPDDTIAAAPLVVEIQLSQPLSTGTHRIRAEPGRDLPHQGETELGITMPPSWRLVAVYRGQREDPAKSTRFSFEGPRTALIEDRSATFVVQSDLPATDAAHPNRSIAVAAIGGALVAIGLGLGVRRRRRIARLSEERTGTGSS